MATAHHFCANCGSSLAPADKFCGHCGHPVSLASSGAGERHEEPVRFVKAGIAPPRPETEAPMPDATAASPQAEPKPSARSPAAAPVPSLHFVGPILAMGASWAVAWSIGALAGNFIYTFLHLDYGFHLSPLVTDLFFVWGFFAFFAGCAAETARVIWETPDRSLGRPVSFRLVMLLAWTAGFVLIGLAGGDELAFIFGLAMISAALGWLSTRRFSMRMAEPSRYPGAVAPFVWAGVAFVASIVQHLID